MFTWPGQPTVNSINIDVAVNVRTYLCAIDQDDAVGTKSHPREKPQKLLQRVSVGLREKETEQPQGISTLGRCGQL